MITYGETTSGIKAPARHRRSTVIESRRLYVKWLMVDARAVKEGNTGFIIEFSEVDVARVSVNNEE